MKHRFAHNRYGFTLIELLVVVAIIALLISIMLPALSHARTAAKIVVAHADLRSISLALSMYCEDNNENLPITRFSCSTRSAYELPVELGQKQYLPQAEKELAGSGGKVRVESCAMIDIFDPEETYRYRAPGAALQNESILMEPPSGANIWVPEGFPYDTRETTAGTYERDPKTSPVRYAIWSVGPKHDSSPKFGNDAPIPAGRAPVPKYFWCDGAADTGVITHILASDGLMHQSP